MNAGWTSAYWSKCSWCRFIAFIRQVEVEPCPDCGLTCYRESVDLEGHNELIQNKHVTFKISSRNQNQVFYMILYVYDKKDHSSSGSLKCSLLVGEGNSQVQMLSQFSFSTRRSASYQQQFNVKMFAGSQTKLWGDSVSTDGTLFCSVETALAHAGFSCHRLQTAAAMEKSLQHKLKPLFAQRRLTERTGHTVIPRCPFGRWIK